MRANNSSATRLIISWLDDFHAIIEMENSRDLRLVAFDSGLETKLKKPENFTCNSSWFRKSSNPNQYEFPQYELVQAEYRQKLSNDIDVIHMILISYTPFIDQNEVFKKNSPINSGNLTTFRILQGVHFTILIRIRRYHVS